MLPKIKNVIIFLLIAGVLILVYVFFIKKSPEETNLISSSFPSQTNTVSSSTAASPDQDFLPLLFNVKNIKLDDAIFSDPAFMTLTDSSIILIPEENEGRLNPFAPLGSEGDNSLLQASGLSPN